jgi:hypothetical protein
VSTLSVWSSILLLVVGAATAFVPTYINERHKEAHQLQTRWDLPLYELSKDFAATVRLFQHLCDRYDRATDKDEQVKKIDEAHAKLRALVQQLRIVANSKVWLAAECAQHHAYNLRDERALGRVAAKREEEYKEYPPVVQLEKAMQEFFVHVRI